MKNQETDRESIAIFKELNSALYPIARKYLDRGWTVYFFQIDSRFREKKEIKAYLTSKRLIDISDLTFDYVLLRQPAVYAHQNVDRIFDKFYAHSPSIKNMANLLEFPGIENMYKKGLLLVLEQIYIIELKINNIAKRNNAGEVHFYPADNLSIHSDESSLLAKNVKIIPNRSFKHLLKQIFIRVKKEKSIVGSPIYLFVKIVRGISRNKKAKKFKVGINIYHHKNLFSINYSLYNIYIGDGKLSKEDVLFLDECGRLNIADYEKRGYNYVNMLSYREPISTALLRQKIIKRFIPAWLKSVILSFREKRLIVDTNYQILVDYLTWNIFADNYTIKNYVTIMNPDTLSKIHVLSQNNIKTWFIYADNSVVDYHTGWAETTKDDTWLSFLNYDYFVSYGDKLKRHVINQRNFIKEYIMTGVLFAQVIQELQESKLESPMVSIIKQKSLPAKIIGVFDTTYSGLAPLKIEDGIRFGNDMLRLLDDFPEIGIIFKAKKELELTPFLTQVYEKLKNHERCLFFARYNKEGISAAEVIAQSDFVISAAYTSTTAEASGAGKRAIYYDIAGHDIGERFYFNRFPNFVAHSYEEFKKLVHYWVYEANDREFADFLNTYVKGEIDPYLDGKAISRLRKLLEET